MTTEITPAHLGGHMNKVHIDHGAFDYIYNKFKIGKFLDIGCGPGDMVQYALDKGIAAKGVDGDPAVISPHIWRHDFTTGYLSRKIPYVQNCVADNEGWIVKTNDNPVHNMLIWSVEFLEHVEEQYVANIMEAFSRSKYVVMTHALPGETGGHHHVNLKDEAWWIAKFAEYNLKYNEEETKAIRAASTMTKGFMKKTGKFFINDRQPG